MNARGLAFLCVVGCSLLTARSLAEEDNSNSLNIPDDLKIETLSKPEPCERQAADGDMLVMHYTGYLAKDNTKFDSSYDRPSPFTFQLGRKQVIPGWDMGLLGMCKGEKRKLTIPPELAYGERGAGNLIPGGATLVFETELVDIHDAPPQQNIFKAIDADEDLRLSRTEMFNFIEAQIEQHQQGGTQELDTDKIIADIFQNEDADQDGYISHDEFRGPKHDEL
ncbi:uncharacterized protein LOC129590872 [Paramacrobiotus metropolitanus]|uniref:uncharacterized protein LOC129590872 n=1 Tax=Paramacrobiotus metropolitanus TaxID=2943436 RepID=UPI0024465C9D|nr:uncharacterized protein LOC129590872 [Paramacrobiotus metropolitanus]